MLAPASADVRLLATVMPFLLATSLDGLLVVGTEEFT
jgi:hypothetical protein